MTREPATADQAAPHAVARWCAMQGWPVHPLAPGRKTPAGNCKACKGRQHPPAGCPCLSQGRPCHGFHAATTDLARIDAWWSRTPSWGVGVACGGADLIVIDVDAHSSAVPDRSLLLPGIAIHDTVDLRGLASGFETLALLAALRRQPSPADDDSTLRVRTPSGGLHVWYRNPYPTIRFRCSTGSGRNAALAWQVDVRADGGYIVAPTTRTVQGTYVREGPARLPAPLPDWLGKELVRTGHVIQPRPTRTRSAAPGRSRPRTTPNGHRVLAPLLLDVTECARTPEGASFTAKLNKAAYTAGGLAAAGHLEPQAARTLLLEAAETARPQQSFRNERIVDDAFAAGSVRPFRLEGKS
ncbi:bifunctional DNA primase/polymerase (plasmid) [Streptomyces chartreusis]|nr:bifunctional DNA primase/polymerase [Streptomyces chartreusis]WTA33747.1 bifunctional DNA primase/polymerase [Streptomyces chartreusis]